MYILNISIENSLLADFITNYKKRGNKRINLLEELQTNTIKLQQFITQLQMKTITALLTLLEHWSVYGMSHFR